MYEQFKACVSRACAGRLRLLSAFKNKLNGEPGSLMHDDDRCHLPCYTFLLHPPHTLLWFRVAARRLRCSCAARVWCNGDATAWFQGRCWVRLAFLPINSAELRQSGTSAKSYMWHAMHAWPHRLLKTVQCDWRFPYTAEQRNCAGKVQLKQASPS